jgi:dTDP-4-dehydrorhamnose reductase
MRVLVLGSNGQLGSDLLDIWRRKQPEFEVIHITRKELDVTHLEDIKERLKSYAFDMLVNCTSYHKTDEAEKNATQAFTINAHAVRAMAEACENKDAGFIHISTDYVFSGDINRPYVETDCPCPINVYGASKAMGESLALMAHNQVFVLRVASLFGVAGASGKGGNFVETMLSIAKEKGEVRVINDITMSPTSTAEVANMILGFIEQQPEPGIYHAVNSGEATWYEFAQEIINQAGVDAQVLPISSDEFPAVAKRPAYSVLNNTKISAFVGNILHWKQALTKYLCAKGHIKVQRNPDIKSLNREQTG